MQDLYKLLREFEDINDQESETAYFRTNVPSVAPLAYLHIIFKPVPDPVRSERTQALQIPRSLADFYRAQNGAILFSGSMSIYGLHQPGQLIERDDVFRILAFNIEDHNSEPPRPSLLCCGGYSVDGSSVWIDRIDGIIYRYMQHLRAPCNTWRSLEEWIGHEISRLSALFDRRGTNLSDLSFTAPPHDSNVN
jgi:hypothetical protein